MATKKDWSPDLRGVNYRPYITVRMPSRGKVSRLGGHTTGREHHVLSSLELNWLYVYDWRIEEIDIREQFALPLDETVAIAEDLGIPHPIDRASRKPFRMTSDFLLTRQGPFGETDHVRSCKYAADLENMRTLELEEIARQYWERQGIEWKLATERDLPSVFLENIQFVHTHISPESVLPLPSDRIPWLTDHLMECIAREPERGTTDLCAALDQQAGYEPGTHLGLIRHAIGSRRWLVDMYIPIKGSQPLRPVLAPKQEGRRSA